MPERLATRLTVGYVALMVVVFVLLGVYLTSYIRDVQARELTSRLQAQAWLVAEASGPLLAQGADGAVDSLAHRAGAEVGARVTVIRRDGTVLGDSEADATTMENHRGRPELRAALAGQTGQSRRMSATLHQELLYVAVPIVRDGQIIGAARVAEPTDRFDAWLHGVLTAVIIALAAAAVAIAVVSGLVARIVTRPLAALVVAARRVARGDLTARTEVRDGGEVSELAHAFNEMTDELRQLIGEIDDDRGRLEAILENLTDGILIVDGDGLVVMINRAAGDLLDIQRERAIGHPYAEAVRDHELVALIQAARDAGPLAKAAPGRSIETVRPRRSVFAHAYAIPHHQTPLVVILRDVTELRRTETIRRDFVANVSHELRTPIASIKALVETLVDGAMEDEEAAREFLGRMEVEVERLAALVSDLLELSRVESGRVELRSVPGAIEPVARRVTERLRTQAERQGVALQVEMAPDLPLVSFDPARVEQVLVNLVHNAIKFTPAGGSVTLTAEADEASLLVRVKDTGRGIARQDLDRVFERFYKADRSRADSGTGLGLAIAKHLVELQGGRIWAASEPGRGATFTFSLPLAPDRAAADASPAEPSHAGSSS